MRKEDIYALIPVGHDHAISRASLAAACGMSDREMRRAIEILRRTYCICNDSATVLATIGHGWMSSTEWCGMIGRSGHEIGADTRAQRAAGSGCVRRRGPEMAR